MANLRLTIIEAGGGSRVEEIDSSQAPIKIGRLSSSHLRFEDSSVSRIHAVIEKGGGDKFVLVDLGSASGTFVNGAKITKQELSSGDEMRFGNIVVMFEVAVEAAQASDFAAESTVVSQGLQDKLSEDVGAAPAQVAPSPSAQSPGVQVSDSYIGQMPSPSSDPYAAPQPAYGQYDQSPSYGDASSGGAGTITTADGTQVEPYTLQGYYDDEGNYFPGYYDDAGEYQFGYGYYDEAGQWCLAYGYYDPQGEWIDTDYPVTSLSDLPWNGPSDVEYYTESFFENAGGDTLEVAMLWADQVLAVNSYPQPRSVKIGTNKDSDFVLEDPALSAQDFPLVSYDGSSYALTITDQMTGMIQNGDQRFTLAEAIQQGIAKPSTTAGAYSVSLGAKTSARVDIGDVTFLVHFTDQPVMIAGGLSIEVAPLLYIGGSGVAHILFLIIALILPPNPAGMELDAFAADDRFVQAMIMPEQEEEEEPDWLGDGDGEEAAAKHAGEEGQAGKEDSEQTNKQLAIKGPSNNSDIQLKKSIDTQVATNSGALAVLGNQVSSPFGTASESIGSDAIHALGNVQGDGVGEARGFGGLGLAGAGRGGGGISERGIGMADVGTKGKGGRGGGGSKYGRSASDLGEKRARVPKLVPGKPKVMGSLDKEIIRRVVRQHRNEIRYCYEKELQKNPKLAGTVKIKFTISGTGSVVAALVNSSTLNNSKVERCMTGKIRRWVFPEPKGGGIVTVTYPFNFSS